MPARARKDRLVEVVQPMLGRPPQLQAAALCTRPGTDGGTEVLLITSRGSGRWVLPKGWPMRGRSLAEAAGQEAWEEAGIRGRVEPQPMGRFAATKTTPGGLDLPCEVAVFRLHVTAMEDLFPEAGQRRRRWLRPDEAAGMVREPGLRRLLAALSHD